MTEPLSNGKAVQLKATEDVAASQDELRMLRKRQNEQMVVYLLVCFAIVAAWILGSWQFSFVWTFVIALFTLVIWRSKVLTLTERNLQYRETILHRRRSLRQSESAEWLNFLLNRWSVFRFFSACIFCVSFVIYCSLSAVKLLNMSICPLCYMISVVVRVKIITKVMPSS